MAAFIVRAVPSADDSFRPQTAVATRFRLGDVWITRPADLGRVLRRERERPPRCGMTIAPAQKEAPAADGPTLMHRQGLRARGSPVFALSRWTNLDSARDRFGETTAPPALRQRVDRAVCQLGDAQLTRRR